MKPRRPYLLRAMHEWISDSECTPHIVVDAGAAGVEVPRQYVRDGKIVLNVSWSATAQLVLGNDELRFSGRFGGVSMTVRVPVEAVLAIYARETGQGLVFPEGEDAPTPEPPPASPQEAGGVDSRPKPAPGRAKLKVVK